MEIFKYLAVHVLMCVLCCSVIAQDNLEVNANLQLVESLVEASIANATAIESGDVLWKSSDFFDSTDLESLNRPNKNNPAAFQPGKLMVHETWNRLIFDHTEKRYFYISRKIFKLNDFHDDMNEPVLKVFWKGIVHDEKNQITHWTSQPGSKESKSLNSNDQPVYPIPDIRVASETSASSLASFETAMRNIRLSGTLRKLEVTDKSYVVLLEWDKGDLDDKSIERPKVRHFSELRFDINSLQKTSMNAWVIDAQGEKFRSGTRMAKWTELNGLFVPIVASGESATRLLVYGEPTFGMVEKKHSFHWFSVNEGVEHAKVFDGEPFESLEAFERMLDPVKTNASNLIR